MEKKEIVEFFDRCAPWWDADMIRDEELLSTILTLGGIREGIDVLDVACGTGVLFPDYQKRAVRSVTGIDISPEMVKLATAKFPEIPVICGDVETTDFGRQFDAVMVYNAFPHFPDPARLIRSLAQVTRPGGRLSIAHSMSRAALTDHHKRASKVSIELLHEKELATLLAPWFDVDVVISTDRMYQVSGVRRDGTAHAHGGQLHSHSLPEAGADHNHAHAPMDELLALMRFMVEHNDAHAQELAELATQLESAGKVSACEQIMRAVSDFDVVNARISAIATSLGKEAEL